jgi:hypothetical protein
MQTHSTLTTAQQTALEYLNAEMVLEGNAADRSRARYYDRIDARWRLITRPELERLGESLLNEYEDNGA